MVDTSQWHDFAEGEPVLTREGYPGKVDEVLDGPGAGNEHYRVTLDNGVGGGTYAAHELSPLSSAAVKTADLKDYPELVDLVAAKPPPPANISAEDYLSGLFTGADTLYGVALALRKQADDGGDHGHSAMVALPIPADVAQQAAVPGGLDPSEMHVTLAYLPNPTPEQLAAAHQVVATHASFLGPINASIEGAGQFPAGDDGVPHYAPVDAPGNVLPSLAASIQSALENNDVEVAHPPPGHGFITHDGTMSYATPHLAGCRVEAAQRRAHNAQSQNVDPLPGNGGQSVTGASAGQGQRQDDVRLQGGLGVREGGGSGAASASSVRNTEVYQYGAPDPAEFLGSWEASLSESVELRPVRAAVDQLGQPRMGQVQTLPCPGCQEVSSQEEGPFVPHMTRTYLPEGEPAPEPVEPQQFQIPGLVVAQGDDWTHYPFTGMGDPDQDSTDEGEQDPDETIKATKQAGFWSDFITGRPGPAASNYAWCKFLHDQLCVFPKNLDVDATMAAGQARWVPTVRGRCTRDWQQQANCPVGEPSISAQNRGVASLFEPKSSLVSEDPEVAHVAAIAEVSDESVLNFILAVSPGSTLVEPNYITAAEARGDSRAVSREEYRQIADQGRQMLDEMHRGKAPITGLDNNWNALKAHSWSEVQKPWGGATIDAHTGVPLQSDADKYALTVKPPGMNSISVHEHAPQEQFHQAMDRARDQFRPLLENQRYHLGVFHDDDNHRIDIDPVVVVNSPDEVHKIGAQTHAIGGAFHFRSGNGFFPPHVSDQEHEAARKEADVDAEYGEQDSDEPDFKGPGHWRSQAEQVQPGYEHHLPED